MSQMGVLYSIATGIALRSINPDSSMGDAHLDWLENNLPDGTGLIRMDKKDVGADENNTPDLDTLIPYVQKNHGITLAFGQNCAVVDSTNTVVDVVLACPVLYAQKLQNDATNLSQSKSAKSLTPTAQALTLVVAGANIGDTFDPVNNVFVPAKSAQTVTPGNVAQ